MASITCIIWVCTYVYDGGRDGYTVEMILSLKLSTVFLHAEYQESIARWDQRRGSMRKRKFSLVQVYI